MNEPRGAEKFEVEIVRRDWAVLGIAALPFLLIPTGIALAIIWGRPMALALTILGLTFGAASTAWVWTRNLKARHVPGTLRLEGDAIRIDDGQAIPVATIASGSICGHDGSDMVRLEREGIMPDIEVIPENEEHAHELLAELGFGASQRSFSERTMSTLYSSTASMIGAMFACLMLGVAGPFIANATGVELTNALVVLPIVPLVALLFLRSRVVVGADGVRIKWLYVDRFIPHQEITEVVDAVRGVGKNRKSWVNLTLRDGRVVRIAVAPADWDSGKANLIATRIRDAKATMEGIDSSPLSALQRGELTFADWIAKLRSGGSKGHRDAAVPEEALWRVLEDPRANPVDRSAAAVALKSSTARGAARRIGRAARSVAAPKLRIALSVIADDEPDEAVAEQLEQLEAHERQQSGA